MKNRSEAEELVDQVCDIANNDAGNRPGWSARYLASIEAQGFKIIQVDKGFKNWDGTIDAPIPWPGEESAYPYPSVIAPKAWRPIYD